ncbi:MAG: nuclear transport factor 2 family protein [Bacteroidota bacterium]
MQRAVLSSLLFAVVLTGGSGPALSEAEGQLRIPTVTRLVRQFTVLENSLLESVGKQDSAAVQKMLADDFEMRIGAMPGVPTPRAEWIRQSLKEPAGLSGIEQMAVHDYGNVAVVSFLGRRDVNGARGDLFIVDVWTRSQGAWKLSTRYAGPAGDRRFVVPGAATSLPMIEKKY